MGKYIRNEMIQKRGKDLGKELERRWEGQHSRLAGLAWLVGRAGWAAWAGWAGWTGWEDKSIDFRREGLKFTKMT